MPNNAEIAKDTFIICNILFLKLLNPFPAAKVLSLSYKYLPGILPILRTTLTLQSGKPTRLH